MNVSSGVVNVSSASAAPPIAEADVAEMARLDRCASLASYFGQQLRSWGVPDAQAEVAVAAWSASWWDREVAA